MELDRFRGNPILMPDPSHSWENINVYNPAVVHYRGMFRMWYRAQGTDLVSRIGFAVSEDGFHWKRLDQPVLMPEWPEEEYGVEDPRVTIIGDTLYMVYTGYSRLGTRVMLARSPNGFVWERQGCLLPDEDNKDAALFPEKVGDRYVMLHRRPPNIWLAYSDNMMDWYNHQVIIHPRPGMWGNTRVGGGGPPIKTDQGWLLIYHGYNEAHVYSLGLALLDYEEPGRVLSRPEAPIFYPMMPWERFGEVAGVVFSCGQVILDDTVYVYYGGADRVIGVATGSLRTMIDDVLAAARRGVRLPRPDGGGQREREVDAKPDRGNGKEGAPRKRSRSQRKTQD